MQQRLFEITYLLTAKGAATAGELAQRFGVSRRTIYRDIDALSSAGIPVYTEKGKGGGIRLLPGFVLDKSLFSAEEKSQLLSHLQTLSALDIPDSQATVDKVSALFGSSDTWLKIDFSPWGKDSRIKAHFYQIKNSILQHTIVLFSYTGASSAEQVRRVEPYLILFKSNSWYLFAFCLTRQDFRFFKLARINNLITENSTFIPREMPPAETESTYETNHINFTLQLEASLGYRVYDEFPADSICKKENGDFIVEATLPDCDWTYEYILSFGAKAEVLSPASLRQNILCRLENAVQKYKHL